MAGRNIWLELDEDGMFLFTELDEFMKHPFVRLRAFGKIADGERGERDVVKGKLPVTQADDIYPHCPAK